MAQRLLFLKLFYVDCSSHGGCRFIRSGLFAPLEDGFGAGEGLPSAIDRN